MATRQLPVMFTNSVKTGWCYDGEHDGNPLCDTGDGSSHCDGDGEVMVMVMVMMHHTRKWLCFRIII